MNRRIEIDAKYLLVKLVTMLDRGEVESEDVFLSFFRDGHWCVSSVQIDFALLQVPLSSLMRAGTKRKQSDVVHEVLYLEDLINSLAHEGGA